MNPQEHLEPRYTAAQIAELCNISEATVLREAAQGRLRSEVVGKRSRRFPLSAVEEWLRGDATEPSVGQVIELRSGRGSHQNP